MSPYTLNYILYCALNELGYLKTMEVPVKNVLSDLSYYEEINPKDLLYLQKRLDSFEKNKNKIRLIAEYRNNEYGIACDQIIICKISGFNLCTDLNLLRNMSIENTFSI